MTDETIPLDERRGMTARRETEIRRARHEVEADQAALRRHQAEFENLLVAAPADGWPEAAEKARYLIELFAATPEARDPRRRSLIADVLADFERLAASSGGGAAAPPPPNPVEEPNEE